ARNDRIYAEDLAYMKSRLGPAICYDLKLCFEAGKPLEYEQFMTREQIAAGRFDEAVFVDEINQGKYAVIQSEEGLVYFPPRMLAAFHARYRVDRRSPLSVFYVPR